MNTFANNAAHLASVFTIAVAATLGSAGCATPADGAEVESASEALSVGSLPAGNYRGTGKYMGGAADSDPYRAEYVVSENSLAVHYAWSPKDSSERVFKLQLTWQTAREFTFSFDDMSDAGTGYCVKDRCHFSASSGGTEWYEMTLTFSATSVTGSGSMLHEGQHSYWVETLEKL